MRHARPARGFVSMPTREASEREPGAISLGVASARSIVAPRRPEKMNDDNAFSASALATPSTKTTRQFGARPSPLPFLRLGTVSKSRASELQQANLEIMARDLLETLAKHVPRFASKTLTLNDFAPLHMYYLLKTVVPLLLRGLEELSMTWTLQKKARYTPIEFLASYLMRHNPRFSLHARVAPTKIPSKRRPSFTKGRHASTSWSSSMTIFEGDEETDGNEDCDDDEVIDRVIHRFCAERAERARIDAREDLWETEQGADLLKVWRACCAREGDCMSLEMVRENLHVFRSASMHIELSAEDIFQRLDKSRRGRVSFEDFEEVMGNMLVDNSTALSAARRIAPVSAFAKSRAGDWAREKALEKLEARLSENNIDARKWFKNYTGAARTSLKRMDLNVCLSRMVSTFDLNVSAEDIQEAMDTFGNQDLVDYRDFIRIAAEIIRMSNKRAQALLRHKSRRVMQARFSSNVNRVQVYLRAIEKVEVKLRRLERATRDFQDTFSELLKTKSPAAGNPNFSESMRSLGSLLESMSDQQAAAKKDIGRARRLSLDPLGCSPTSQREIETLLRSSHERVQNTFREKSEVESLLDNIGSMFGGTVPKKKPPSFSRLEGISGNATRLQAPLANTREENQPQALSPAATPQEKKSSVQTGEASAKPEKGLATPTPNDDSSLAQGRELGEVESRGTESQGKQQFDGQEAAKTTVKKPFLDNKTSGASDTATSATEERKLSIDLGRTKLEVQTPKAGASRPRSSKKGSASGPATNSSARSARTARSRKSTRSAGKEVYIKGKLSAAAKSGKLDELKDIFDELENEMNGEALCRQAVNEKDRNGSTPLMHVAWPGDLESARILLENGADPTQANLRLNTPLHFAFERGHREFAKLLLAHGAEKVLKSKNALGKTPADLNPELFRQLGLK